MVDDGGGIVGFLTACILAHPVMPGKVSEIEERYVRSDPQASQLCDRLIEDAIDWFADRTAGVKRSRIALDTAWTNEHVAFFAGHGFENDQTLVTRFQFDTAQKAGPG